MRRGIELLSWAKILKFSEPGHYCDGGGLYLQVSTTGSKSWFFRYQRHGREHYMGLGSLKTINLTEARERARQARICLLDGVDPIERRARALMRKRVIQARNSSFCSCAMQYIEAHEADWSSAKHRQQWERSLQMHVFPVIGEFAVRQIDTQLVLKVLDPIWRTKTETASRIRERIERILSWATIRGYRTGENPARWHGHLSEMLPKPGKFKKIKHYAALPFDEVGSFIALLRKQKGQSAKALEFAILTACRTSEVIGARWDEINLSEMVWTISAERMKTRRIHRVPLVGEMLTLVENQKGIDPIWVFPGERPGRPLSNMAMLKVLKRMGRSDITVHGFRSTFRDWAAEKTDYPREVLELALAHIVGSASEQAYWRTDLFDKRRRLMLEWAATCCANAIVGAER